MARAMKAADAESPGILGSFKTAIGTDLRNSVMVNGEVNPAKLAQWTASHRDLLAEMPDIAQNLQTANDAQGVIERAESARIKSADQFKTRAAQDLLAGADPDTAMAHLLSSSPEDVRKFLGVVNRDPTAAAGAKKAMSNYLANLLLNPRGVEEGEETVSVRKLRSLINNPGQMYVVRQVLGDKAPTSLRQVLRDYDALNSSSLMKRVQPGSPTAPIYHSAKELKQPHTLLGRILDQAINPTLDTLAVGLAHPAGAIPAAAASSAAKAAIGNMRSGALRIVAEALADPNLFLELTKPIPKNAAAAKRLMRAARGAFAAAAGNVQQAGQSIQ